MPRSRIITAVILALALFGFVKLVELCGSLPSYAGRDHASLADFFGQSFADYNKAGFRRFCEGFATTDEAPELNMTLEIDNLKVHVVGSREFFKWDKARNGPGIAGYATKKNHIWVFGRYAGGKIVLNQAILGHELNHLLNFKNGEIADPDELEGL